MAANQNPFEKLLAQTKADMLKKAEQKAATVKTPEGPMPNANEPASVPVTPKEAIIDFKQEVVESRNPFLTAQTSVFSTESVVKLEVDIDDVQSIGDLARVNTDDVEPSTQDRPTYKNEVAEAAKLTKALVLDDPNKVRKLCDEFDAQLNGIKSLVGPELSMLRNHVQTLMMTLKEHPEFDEIVIAKDVQNIFRWIRATRADAVALREVKTEKRVVKEVKKSQTEKKVGTAQDFSAAFNSIMFNMGDKK